MTPKISCIILAAGHGTRMNSDLPKVMHKISGKPMISILVDTLLDIGIDNVITIVGFKEQLIKTELGVKVNYVTQKEQLGTGHAVLQAQSELKKMQGKVLILCGDAPLISQITLNKFIEKNIKEEIDASIITVELENPFGYGRIIKDNAGRVIEIIEEKDADAKIKKVREINTGMYCFNIADLLEGLKEISNNNQQNEYYLTDIIKILNKKEKKNKNF
jgi:bifunctional UDP-N-acetylglucosamine pyrophosphorylase / glucosamine-1-phosphate N-acetyltransferase